jgi:hypothetical protein
MLRAEFDHFPEIHPENRIDILEERAGLDFEFTPEGWALSLCEQVGGFPENPLLPFVVRLGAVGNNAAKLSERCYRSWHPDDNRRKQREKDRQMWLIFRANDPDRTPTKALILSARSIETKEGNVLLLAIGIPFSEAVELGFIEIKPDDPDDSSSPEDNPDGNFRLK